MKLYRAEVAPIVDVAVDVSPSMSLTAEKQERTDQLLAFCVECADRAGAAARVHAVSGQHIRAASLHEVRSNRWRERLAFSPAVTGGIPSPGASSSRAANDGIGPVPWRPNAMKVLISDLLFPSDPSKVLVPLAAASGLGMILAPALADEADLPWRGNVDLTDCENGTMRRQRIDDALATRYHAAYARHFALWREACRKRGVLFGRIAAEGALSHVLSGEAFQAGVVEAVS